MGRCNRIDAFAQAAWGVREVMTAAPAGAISTASGGTITQPAWVSLSTPANFRSPRNAIAPPSAEDKGATEAMMRSPPRSTAPPILAASSATLRGESV